MNIQEFSDQFDVLYSNITSNQAPGLNEYEKSVFLTKAQDEIVKNYFTANSKGNNIGQGFDDSAKRQADFSNLMKTQTLRAVSSLTGDYDTVSYSIDEEYTYIDSETGEEVTATSRSVSFQVSKIDPRSRIYTFPGDVFITINETLSTDTTPPKIFQVVPLRYDEYLRLMSKPYKRPVKNQAWRLINSGTLNENLASINQYIKCVEVITGVAYDAVALNYTIRYIRRPHPIIVGPLDGLTIHGEEYNNASPIQCELDPIIHEDILQRAVELAKVAWTANGQENVQLVMQAGQRSE